MKRTNRIITSDEVARRVLLKIMGYRGRLSLVPDKYRSPKLKRKLTRLQIVDTMVIRNQD